MLVEVMVEKCSSSFGWKVCCSWRRRFGFCRRTIYEVRTTVIVCGVSTSTVATD